MSTRIPTSALAALAAGWIVAAAAPAMAAEPGGAVSASAGRAMPSAPEPTKTPAATAAVQPAREALPAVVRTLLDEADAALRQGRNDMAREWLEQAETRLLNNRVDGEKGFPAAVRDIAAARAALSSGDRGAARREIANAMHREAGEAG